MTSTQDDKASVYVEVTMPTDNGERVVFYTQEYTTEELDTRKLHEMLEHSETAVVENLGIRHKTM